MVDEITVKKYKWALFVRFSILLSIASIVFMLRGLHLSAWVVTKNSLDSTTSALRPLNDTSGDPFHAFGDVRGARFGIFEFCLEFEVEEWGNIAAPICWPYTETLTLDGVTSKACEHIDMTDDLCAASSRTIGSILVALILLGVADIFSEKVAVVIGCTFIACIPIAFIVLGTWVGFLFHLRNEDEWMVFEWGSGLENVMYAMGTGIGSLVMMTVALCCWHFDPDDHDNEKYYSFLLAFNPWREDGPKHKYARGSAKAKHDERIKHEQLSGRQHFFSDNVGVLGRVGAFMGLVSWALLLSAAHVPDWIVLDDTNGTSITELSYFEGGTFGFSEYCLQRDVASLGQFNQKQTVCFPYSHEGTIIETKANGDKQTITFNQIDDIFEEYDINFSRRTLINYLLFGGILLAVVGDLYSEWTLLNSIMLFACALLCIVAAALQDGLMQSMNNESENLVSAGTGHLLIVVTIISALLGSVFNFIDSCFHGELKVRLGLNEKCFCCREEQSVTAETEI
eukprot:m.97731 g.97731  ORF g.97731 m.97731 type:complete len:511 (+) comp27005_c0_seq1:166-1698(+)